MSNNYRRYRKSYSETSSGRRRTPINRWILIAVCVIIVGFLGRMLLTHSPSTKTTTKNSDDIQSLDSLLKNNNININGVTNVSGNTNAVASANAQKVTCDRAYSAIDTTDKVIALTFDSSPIVTNAQNTLDELKKESVPATFFLTGEFATSQAALAKAIADGGFAIANHSDTHTDFSTLTAAAITKEITDASAHIATATGKTPLAFVRPPFGTLGVKNAAVTQLTKDKECTLLWSIDGQDWKKESTKDTVAAAVKAGLKPGAIIMLQFGNDASDLALPAIIADAKQAGYRFVNLTDYFSPPQ